MVTSMVRPAEFWRKGCGRTLLNAMTEQIIQGGGWEAKLRACEPRFASRPDKHVFADRIKSLQQMGIPQYDVMVGLSHGSSPEAVRWLTGYSTEFAEVGFGVGPHGAAILADPELGETAKHHIQRFNLPFDVVKLEGFGLAGEEYHNMEMVTLAQALINLAGGNRTGLHIGVLTGGSNLTLFIDHLNAAAAQIPGAKITFDSSILPYHMYNKDLAEIASARKLSVLAGMMLDIGLGLSMPNVPEIMIGDRMRSAAADLGAERNDWSPIVASGAHNNATIGFETNELLTEFGPLNIGGCPYAVWPAPAAPTERASSFLGVNSIDEVPEQTVYAYRGIQAYFLAALRAFKTVAVAGQGGHVPVSFIDRTAQEALAEYSVDIPGRGMTPLTKMITYSIAHIMGAKECGLPQDGIETGDITDQAAHFLPAGWGLFGLDAGLGGKRFVYGDGNLQGVPYLVIEKTLVTNLETGLVDLQKYMPIDLGRLIAMTGTSDRTPDMYEDLLRITEY